MSEWWSDRVSDRANSWDPSDLKSMKRKIEEYEDDDWDKEEKKTKNEYPLLYQWHMSLYSFHCENKTYTILYYTMLLFYKSSWWNERWSGINFFFSYPSLQCDHKIRTKSRAM